MLSGTLQGLRTQVSEPWSDAQNYVLAQKYD